MDKSKISSLMLDLVYVRGHLQGLSEGSKWKGAKPITAEMLTKDIDTLKQIYMQLWNEFTRVDN